jgi:hypothetical protein
VPQFLPVRSLLCTEAPSDQRQKLQGRAFSPKVPGCLTLRLLSYLAEIIYLTEIFNPAMIRELTGNTQSDGDIYSDGKQIIENERCTSPKALSASEKMWRLSIPASFICRPALKKRGHGT